MFRFLRFFVIVNNRVVRPIQTVETFRERAEIWLFNETSRKRKPVADSTKDWWRGCLDNWLIPNLGDLPVSTVNNGTVKPLIPIMREKLSPKSIVSYVGVIKLVVASAVDKDGEELYPRKWNAEFMDLPIVEKGKQNTPLRLRRTYSPAWHVGDTAGNGRSSFVAGQQV